MQLKTRVGQIFLEHPKDENYSSVYEETFTKQGRPVQLFAVMEIAEPSRIGQIRSRKPDYEELLRSIVVAFKKTYIQAPAVNEDTFERALAAVNAALSKLGTKGKIGWFGGLQAALGAFSENELCLSTTGNAVVHLVRAGNFTLLSEGLADDAKPVKIFANYAAGKLLKGDRVILSTKQLFNYLSLDRIKEAFRENDLDDICHEIISGLADIKNIGFATFIFETADSAESALPKTRSPQPSEVLNQSPAVLRIVLAAFQTAGQLLLNVIQLIFRLLYGLIARKARPGSKKPVFVTIGIVAVLLLASIGFSIWQRSRTQKLEAAQANLTRAEEILNEAEAALIYQDDERVLHLTQNAQNLLLDVKGQQHLAKLEALKERLKSLKDKINKEKIIETPTVLSTFPMIPTDLLRSPNGFLAFNRNTGVLAFYDFRSGETREILADKNTSAFILGGSVGGTHGFVFFQRGGKFAKVDIPSDTSTEYPAESPNLVEADKAKIQDLAVLGEGNAARIYLLDTVQNQIWRFRITDEASIGSAEGWLKSEAALADALDMAVDNNIYVLFSNRLERYFNGSKQNFALSSVSPAMQNATRVFTDVDQQMLYVLEPSAERILVYNKTGRLQTQFKSPKLRDASDFSVDERNKIIYLIAGSELLQVNY